MTKFQGLLLLFLISVIAGIIGLVAYIKGIAELVQTLGLHQNETENVNQILSIFFNPVLLISFVVAIIASLAFRILAIVHVSNSTSIEGGEKALWIIGLIFISFITGIIFLVFLNNKRFDREVELKGDVL